MGGEDFFYARLGRLKVALRATKDKEVAEALGLGEKAFNARKSRGSFPEKEVRALAQRRPELAIDVDYVLTGVTEEESLRQRAVLHAAVGMAPDSHPAQPLSRDELDLLDLYRAAPLTAKVDAVRALQSSGAPPPATSGITTDSPGAGMVNHGTGAVQVGKAGGKVTVKKGR